MYPHQPTATSPDPGVLRKKLRDAGYSPIPTVGKAPKLKKWQIMHGVSDAVIESWRGQGTNTGLLARHTPAFDIDILGAAAVDAIVAFVRERYDDEGRILKRVGLPPKALIPFRADIPFKKIKLQLLPAGATQKTKPQALEFLGDGQQFVGFGIHPDTKSPYAWDDAGEPGDVRREKLPLITQEEARALIEDAATLLVEQFGYTRASTRAATGTAAPSATTSKAKRNRDQALNVYQSMAHAEIDEVASAMATIPNDDAYDFYDDWKAMLMAIFVATGGSDAGFRIADEWSARSKAHYNAKHTRMAWREIKKSPPNRTGVEKIFALARARGWRAPLAIVKSNGNPANNAVALDVAEAKTREIIRDRFIRDIVINGKRNVWTDFAYEARFGRLPWPAHGLDVDMAVGKTQVAIEEIAAYLNGPYCNGFVIYAVPTHDLAEEIKARFAGVGITNVEIWRGRDQPDPDNPDDAMCLNRRAADFAVQHGLKVYETCCKSGDDECMFFKLCKHVAQRAMTPKVWIVTHEMLFTAETTFEGAKFLVVDEDCSRKGIRGIEDAKSWNVPLDTLEKQIKWGNVVNADIAERDRYRQMLARVLRQHCKPPVRAAMAIS